MPYNASSCRPIGYVRKACVVDRGLAAGRLHLHLLALIHAPRIDLCLERETLPLFAKKWAIWHLVGVYHMQRGSAALL